jgi:cytochrome b561/polyisoprenoid-binding protein YceI
MATHNSNALYGSVTKTFHWLTALLILTAIPLGVIANQLGFETGPQIAQKAWLFSLHKTVGIMAFFVALLRILWAFSQTKPGLLNGDNAVEATAAEVVHWLLYFSLVLVPLSGWIHHAASQGFAPVFLPFGDTLPLVPKSETLSHMASSMHWVLTKVLVASLLLHIAGALKHAVIDRDDTLKRMLPGKIATPSLPAQHASKLPLVIAVLVYGAAMGLGTYWGQSQSHDHEHTTAEAAPLAAVQSDWQVSEGTLAIVVNQFGSDVTGSFADWTAEISFDAEAQGDTKGTVDVTIAIASLTLGSVTDQAMGSDFFDAETFPTARFTAEIVAIDAGYEAQGTLTLKGTTAPITLPFALDIVDNVATMQGETTLARLDYNVGESMPDEGSLGFNVAVKIDLTASKAP